VHTTTRQRQYDVGVVNAAMRQIYVTTLIGLTTLCNFSMLEFAGFHEVEVM
jgi:hypothetical protein